MGHSKRSEVEIELTRRQSELQFLDETSRKELNVPVAELEIPEDTSPEVLQAAETAYQETRTKIENLGAVNPTAWDEFQEAQQRHDFLTAQRQDLLDSIRDTERAIHLAGRALLIGVAGLVVFTLVGMLKGLP